MKSAKKTVRLSLDLDKDQATLLMAALDTTISTHLSMTNRTRTPAMLAEAVDRASRGEAGGDISWEILKTAPVYRALLDACPRAEGEIGSEWAPSSPSAVFDAIAEATAAVRR